MRYLMRCYAALVAVMMLAFVPPSQASIDLSSLTAVPTDQVGVEYVSTHFNRRTGQATYEISVTNNAGGSLPGPIYVVVNNFPSQATVQNPDDTTNDGNPVKIINAGTLASGDSATISLIWKLEGRVRLSFDLALYVSDLSPPTITEFVSASYNLVAGQSTELSWQVEDADNITLSPPGSPVAPSSSQTVSPTETTTYTLTASNSGGSVSKDVTITVQPRLGLSIRANPASGNAPISIRFSPLTDTFTAINLYRWDFNGDGRFDRNDTVGRDQTFYYSTPGIYDVLLEATASDGAVQQATYTLNIQNSPPVVSASVSVTNGIVPLTVMFAVSGSDSNGIANYEWDFEGDGTVDYSNPNSGSTTYLYQTAGNYKPSLKVTDQLGASTTVSLPDIEIRALPPGSTTVDLIADTTIGNAPLTVDFSSSVIPGNGQTISGWSWDFEGDGTVDSSQANTASHTYPLSGTYFATLEVTMSDGQVAKDIVKVTVNGTPPVMTPISDHTLNSDIGDTSEIATRLTTPTRLQLQIEDSRGDVVRTLIPWQVRDPGTYNDNWDGTDDSGTTLPEGPYYAVLLYEDGSGQQRLDLRDSTGGRQYNPRRTRIPSRFSPYDNDPLDITFTVNRPSEITAFMGLFRTNTRLVTFLQRVPHGAGSYTVYWNGEAPNGQIIEPVPRNPFLFGIWGWELAYNVIFVRNAPQVAGVEVTPGVFIPSGNIDSNGNSMVDFTLSKPATVELVVSDVDSGTEVAHRQYSSLPSGANQILWDGKNDQGELLAPGDYRLGIRAVGSNGANSMFIYGMQRIFY